MQPPAPAPPRARASPSSSSSSGPPSPGPTSPSPGLPAVPESRAPVHLGLCRGCKRFYRRTEVGWIQSIDRWSKISPPSPPQSRRALDYDDLLEQKRREEQSYRSGSKGLRGASSESALGPGPAGALQGQLDSLSQALSRLQGSLDDSGPAPGLPPGSPRKTWSAPNTDPFGGEIEVPNNIA
jgi:hypothetical protein